MSFWKWEGRLNQNYFKALWCCPCDDAISVSFTDTCSSFSPITWIHDRFQLLILLARGAEIFLMPFIMLLETPVLFTFCPLSGQEMCFLPWLKAYLTSHFIYFFWFFLIVQPYHLNILWQIWWVKQFTRPCQIQQQILQNTHKREGILAGRVLAQPK